MSSQEVDVGLSFELPVNLAKIGAVYLTENPVAGFIGSLLAFIVLAAILVVPMASLLGIQIFPGLLPHSRRSLGDDVDLWAKLEELMGPKGVEGLLSEPLDEFLERVMGGDRRARATQTVGGFLSRAARSLTPLLSLLDYDNAFAAVQVPGEECRLRLMCHVHNHLYLLPALLQRAYGLLWPHMKQQKHYSRAILKGISGSDCDLAFPDCSYNVLQMASFVPFLRRRNHHANEL